MNRTQIKYVEVKLKDIQREAINDLLAGSGIGRYSTFNASTKNISKLNDKDKYEQHKSGDAKLLPYNEDLNGKYFIYKPLSAKVIAQRTKEVERLFNRLHELELEFNRVQDILNLGSSEEALKVIEEFNKFCGVK